MSTNCNKLQYSPKEETTIPSPDHEILLPPNHEIRSESHENRVDSDRREEDGDTKINDREENCEAKISSRKSENSVREEEEDDGFRTPTSIDHKIPAITQCPSPPRKSRPHYSRLKRRAPPESCRRRLQFITAAEIESVLWPMIGDYAEEEKRSKKARTTGGDEI